MMHAATTRQEELEKITALTTLVVVNEVKWTLERQQALSRDVVSLITSNTPSIKKVGDLLKRTKVWRRVFNTPFESPTEWADMHPPLVIEMLEAAGKLGEVCSVQNALTDLANTGQWLRCSFEDLDFHYDHYTRQRVSSIFYAPYS